MLILKLNKWRQFPGWEYGKRAFKTEKSINFSGNCQEHGLAKVKLHAGKYQEMT